MGTMREAYEEGARTERERIHLALKETGCKICLMLRDAAAQAYKPGENQYIDIHLALQLIEHICNDKY